MEKEEESSPIEGSRDEPAAMRAEQHAPLIAAGVFSVLTALLLLRSAQWSPQTALAVMAQSGTANVLLGSALTMVPLIAAGAVGGILSHIWRPESGREGWRRAWKRLALSGTVVIFGLLLAPPALVLMALVTVPLLRRQSDDVPDSKGAAWAALLVLVWLVWVAKPWWPLERIELRNSEPVVGFVLSSSERDVSVLRDDPRRVLFVPSDEVVGRDICTGDPAGLVRLFSEPTWSIVSDPAGYPSCYG